MKKNHFFIPYAGNKRSEVEKIYNSLKDKIEDIEYIVEPFCGTSAFSYYMSIQHPKKYKYILNDNNNYLIDLYKISQDDNKLNDLINELNLLLVDIDKEKYNKIIKEPKLSSYILKHTLYCIRPGLFPLTRTKKNYNYLLDTPKIKFLKNEDITFYNEGATKIFEMYNNNNKALIFLDPPYLQLCNDFYLDSSINIYEYLNKNNINNMKSFIVLVLEDNWIIKLLFQNHNIIYYNKLYQTSKKQTQHIIINNRD